MSVSISMSGIDDAISNLNYRSKASVKFKMISAIRSFYKTDDDIESISSIDTDILIRMIWETGRDPLQIKSRRKNFSSIKTSINNDLKKLFDNGENPEGITIGPGNAFTMSDSAKDRLLSSFSDSVKSGGRITLNQVADVLGMISDFMSEYENKSETMSPENELDQIKKMLKKMSDMSEEEEEDSTDAGDGNIAEDEIVDDDFEDIEDDDIEIVDEDADGTGEDDASGDETADDDEFEEIEDDDIEVVGDDADGTGEDDASGDETADDDEFEEIEDDDIEIVDEDADGTGEDGISEDEVIDDEDFELVEDDDIEIIDEDELENIPGLEDEDSDGSGLTEDENGTADSDEEAGEEEGVEDPGDEYDEEFEDIADQGDLDEEIEEIDEEDEEIIDDEELEEVEEDDLVDMDEDELDILDDDEDEEFEEVIQGEDDFAGESSSVSEDLGLPSEFGADEQMDESEKNRLLSEQFDGFLGAMERHFNQYLLIPKGKYKVGSNSNRNSSPEQTVDLNDFYMGKYPVTNALFEVFIDKTGYVTTAEKLGYGTVWRGRYRNEKIEGTRLTRSVWKASPEKEIVKGAFWYQPSGPGSTLHNKRNHPVVQVSFMDAMAFAAWTGKRLPNEFEWEAAVRTGKGFSLPWGNNFEENKCNLEINAISDTTPVDHFSGSVNALGIADAIGNVLEWTEETEKPPYGAGTSVQHRVAKGGSFISDTSVRLYTRYIFKSDFSSNILGFRCIAD